MEAGTDLQQRGDTALIGDAAGGGGGDTAEEFQQGALTSTVLADDADNVALLDREIDVFQRPDIVAMASVGTVVGLANLQVGIFLAEHVHGPPAVEVVADGASRD